MRKTNRKLSPFLPLLFLMLAFSPAAFSQNVVTGKVTDSKDGSPVAGVTVMVKGTKTVTQTSADGTFKIAAPGSATLVFTSVGFATYESAVGGKSSVDVSIVQVNQQLNEVVVVAYGTKRKGDLTGSVTSISAKDFQKGVVNSYEQLLQGKVAGLEVTTGGGAPGGGSRIRIRGGSSLNASNNPLLVIDGVPVSGDGIAGSANLLNSINPNDIESISVLKDASATALYGSRASNGVLIITTKKGSKGKIRFNFNTKLSSGIVGKTVKVLSGDEIRALINADAAKTGNNTFKNLLGTSNTDWQKEIYRPAFGWDNNISASGALKDIPYRISFGYLTQDGILKTDNFKRITGSLNLSPKFLNDHLSVNLAVKASNTKNNFADQGAIGSAIAFDPTQPVNGSSSKFGGYYEWLDGNGTLIDLSTRNPMALLNQRDNTSNVNRLVGNIQLDYKIHWFPDLHVLFNFGIDNSKGSGNDNIDSASATNYKTGGRKTYYEQSKTNTITDIQLFYSKDLKKLKTKVDVLVGHSYQDFVTNVKNFASFSYRAIADPSNPQKKDTIAGSEPTFLTDKPEYRLESYLGRVNLVIADKYLITASLRRDASSKFAKENRVGYFPAFALAWKLKDQFLKSVNLVNELKLRFGWGTTGQQDGIPYYSYLPYYARSNSAAQYQFGNNYYSFLRPGAYDPDRRWESTTTTNIGLDFGLLNNRISGTVDYYFKKTKDLLSVVPVAAGGNFDIQVLTNVGNMENKGVEFTLYTIPVKKKNLQWDFGFNFTYNTRKITNLLKQQDPNFKGIETSGISGGTGNNIGRFSVGYSPYVYYVYKQVYDPGTGKPIEGLYEDINRDGAIDEKDRYYYKKPASDIFIGLSTQVVYKKYSLGITGHGALGTYLYNNFNSNNGVLRTIKNPINFIGNASVNYLESGFTNNQYLSDYYIENASFFRLDNINLGYNVGNILKNKASLRIAVSIQNVFVITKYKGLDPENSSDTGVDNNIYPRPRTFSLGFNLDF
ncbi:MAG: SusC/RagA family TonB-linked outer membrane protein [Chitinophagaceae bacterium]|nr:SusC/RagA family TonB-linked outer membrane protein [Chitinophagaceae bacterium]